MELKELLHVMQKKVVLQKADFDMSYIMKKRNILLIKSAKDDVVMPFLDYLETNFFTGNVYMVAKQEDERYEEIYENLKMKVLKIGSDEMYSRDNVKDLINKIMFDCTIFFYRVNVTSSHDNLMEIVSDFSCDHLAVGLNLEVKKLEGLEEYLETNRLYKCLIEWLYKYEFGNK